MTTYKKVSTDGESPIKFLRRFSSIKVDYEKEKRKTISKYQQQGLRLSITIPQFFQDKKDVRQKLRASVERYSLPELYVKMICALFPGLKAKEMPDSNALIKHLKHVFRLSDSEHAQLMDIARLTKLPQRIINLEIVEAKHIPAKDANGLSDPFCVVFVNTRDVAQRTKVIHNSLNPIWKQYFTFKVNDPSRDVLHVEVMDYNEDDEPLRDRIKKFKEIKSPSTLGILLKEIANARSVQELIGSLRIPVSEISSETLERWFKLKNHEDKGEIYLRMALGYNKSKEAATEEFLQILHLLLVYELDRDSSLGTPFYWDEHYDMWSKYILRQFKWQGGLKPKDIVLAKWRAYTAVNNIFPLNANMLSLLLDAVLQRVLGREYDIREISRFWDCTVVLVNTIYKFISDIHDVLPCPVTVLHTYHMLKTLDLLRQFLSSPDSQEIGETPFTDSCVIHSVTKSLRDGANKFYLKVFSDCTTHDSVRGTENPLLVAMESLLKMGQILHEDLRLGITTIQTDFIGILNVDYLNITYTVYDEQYGKMVKHIVEEYTGTLMDGEERHEDDEEEEDHLEEDGDAVKVGRAMLKLYLAVKNMADLAPPNYLNDNLSEYSLRQGYHDWFFHSVATWIDILRKQIIKWVKNSVNLADYRKSRSDDDSKLSRTDNLDSKEIPISSSAIDTAQMFVEIHKFWVSLGWQNPKQSFVIVRKILEELYGYLIYYATQLRKCLESELSKNTKIYIEKPEKTDEFLLKASTCINNINYVKEQVEHLRQQLKVENIIEKLYASNPNEEHEESIAAIRNRMLDHVNEVVTVIEKSCVNSISPRYRHCLQEACSEVSCKATSPTTSKPVLDFLDNCLIILNDNLERPNFRSILIELWNECMDGIEKRLDAGLEAGKPSDYYRTLDRLVSHLNDLFWPREVERKKQTNEPSWFEKYDDLTMRLSSLKLALDDLKAKYYHMRHERQMITGIADGEDGVVTVRTGYVENHSCIILELLNARNLKSYDSNNLSDPYAVISLAPKEYFPSAPSFTTKTHKGTLFPLFEETFKITISKEEISKQGFLVITLYDYDFLGRDDLMGEVFLPFSSIKKVGAVDAVISQSQLHIALTKPVQDDLKLLKRFEERCWDKEAVKFAKMEKEKMRIKKN